METMRTASNAGKYKDSATLVLHTREAELPPAFSGKAQQELYQLYGDPRVRGWGNKWMVTWQVGQEFPWFPAQKIWIHKDFRTRLQDAFHMLEQAGLHREIKTFDGCYNIRYVRGSNSALSVHSWGAAIDLNARSNPLGGEGAWSSDFVRIMINCRIFCGQNWIGRKDPMHFALVNG